MQETLFLWCLNWEIRRANLPVKLQGYDLPYLPAVFGKKSDRRAVHATNYGIVILGLISLLRRWAMLNTK